MNIEHIRLGNIATFINGYAFKPENWSTQGRPIIRIQNLTNSSNQVNYCEKEIDERYIVRKGDILISWSASIGIYEWYNEEAVLNQHIFKVKFNKIEVNKRYFKFIVSRCLDKSMQFMHGSTMKHITKKYFDDILVPIPQLKVQEKTAEALDKAQDLIDKRKAQIELLDELIKSRFIEMFGEPASNPKGWNKDTIGSVIKSLTAGWSANGEAREKREGEKAVLKVSAVTQGFFKADEYKVIGEGVEIKKYVFPEKGDLLFSRANTREMVGATCIIHKDYPDLLLPDKLWKILFCDRVNVFYMKYILSDPSIRAEFSAKSTGTSGSMYNVSMDKFKNIEIPVPTIELQNQFADFVNQVDKLKFEMQNGLKELENNFNSLMQRAFNGELFN